MNGSLGHLALVTPGRVGAVYEPPAYPPAEALELIDVAWDVAERMACQDRELHFRSGVIELRTLRGTVLYEVSPAEAVELMCGAAAA